MCMLVITMEFVTFDGFDVLALDSRQNGEPVPCFIKAFTTYLLQRVQMEWIQGFSSCFFYCMQTI